MSSPSWQDPRRVTTLRRLKAKRQSQAHQICGGTDQPRMRPLRACDRLAVIWSRDRLGDCLQGFSIEGIAVALDLNNTFGGLN